MSVKARLPMLLCWHLYVHDVPTPDLGCCPEMRQVGGEGRAFWRASPVPGIRAGGRLHGPPHHQQRRAFAGALLELTHVSMNIDCEGNLALAEVRIQKRLSSSAQQKSALLVCRSTLAGLAQSPHAISEHLCNKAGMPQATSWSGRSPMHAAAAHGHVAVLSVLLAAGAAVNAATPTQARVPHCGVVTHTAALQRAVDACVASAPCLP